MEAISCSREMHGVGEEYPADPGCIFFSGIKPKFLAFVSFFLSYPMKKGNYF
jgi:hypothetical protein